MRLKYHSLIALGISSIILNGCTTGSGGFLNLGVVDALRKSKACIFKQKLNYSTTPIGNSKFALPTFGTTPTHSSGPVAIDSYTVPQAASAAPTSDCGCNAGATVVNSSQYSDEYYMPIRSELSTSEIVEPPIDSVPAKLIDDAELPSVNPLPSEDFDSDNDDGFDSLDTEGAFSPLGQTTPDELSTDIVAEENQSDDHEQVVDGQNGNDKSIFEAAKIKESDTMKFDDATDPTHAGHSIVEQKPAMLTLHARPAESHNLFDRAAQQKKSLKTMQASHKRNFRQQNSLRKQTDFGDRGYRQAMNTDQTIEFKPLPPVKEKTTAPTVSPKTDLVPLPTKSGKTRKTETTQNRTAKASPRIPILRATTASSASILSLKNLANVIQDDRGSRQQYDADHRTAKGSTTASVNVLKAEDKTIER